MKRIQKDKKKWEKPNIKTLSFSETLSGDFPTGTEEAPYTKS